MKILLTGASGFIGGHILKSLIEKFGCYSIVVLTSNQIPDVECLIYDSTQKFNLDKDVFDDVTHIIHAGAFTPKDNSQSNDIELSFSNIEYTKELLSYSFKNLSRFINISTLDVYAPTLNTLSEESMIDPISLYGSSKLYCEKMIKAFSTHKNISYMNLRVGHVYGPGEEKYKKVIPVAMKNIIENKALELWGKGDDLRSFIFIEDVVTCILNSIDTAESDLDVNIVSGLAVPINDLLNKIIVTSGKNVAITRKDSNHQKRDLVFDNRLLLTTLLNKETDLMNGLKKEYDYMKCKYENNI